MDTIKEFIFHHNGDKILISDVLEDCNDVEEALTHPTKEGFLGCSIKTIDLPAGTYRIIILEKEFDKWGSRIKAMMILNTLVDYDIAILNTKNWKSYFDFMVDGGSCLVFSNSVLEDKLELDMFLEKWMSCQCDNILKLETNNQISAFGICTGFGDGIYEFSKYCENNKIVGLKVTFVNDDEK